MLKSRQTASNYLKELVEAELLVMEKIWNENIYINPYLVSALKAD